MKENKNRIENGEGNETNKLNICNQWHVYCLTQFKNEVTLSVSKSVQHDHVVP